MTDSTSVNKVLTSLDIILNVFALPDLILAGNPLRAVNLQNERIKESMSNALTSSKWTARVAAHVNRQT